MRQLLLSAREIAAAEHAEIVFAPALPGRAADPAHHRRRAAASSATTPPQAQSAHHGQLDIPDPVHAQVLRTGERRSCCRTVRACPAVPTGAATSSGSGAARRLRYRCATLSQDSEQAEPARPSPAAAPVTGSLMVAGRVGQVRTFDAADLRLVETIANHAGLALRNGWLINGLTHAVRHDALTGLVNRSYLHQQLTDVLAEIRSGDRAGAAVMICDLNGFKDVNDALGHQMGDVLLQEVALRAHRRAGPRRRARPPRRRRVRDPAAQHADRRGRRRGR